ncbi:hypothetical protein HK098_006907 [Nowakowskiella sp. JEL0407]|nr:hypothetical protein HK098_006907 [Nowakowskiella sp. JEL0407]
MEDNHPYYYGLDPQLFIYERVEPTLLPRIRHFKFVRHLIPKNPPNPTDFYYMPMATTLTEDQDMAVFISFEVNKPRPVFVTRHWLGEWGKTGEEVFKVALKNLYARAKTPIRCLPLNNVGKYNDGNEYKSRHFAICHVDLSTEMMLLPFMFMPFTRVLDGDIVLIVACDSHAIVKDTYICGSNDLPLIRFQLEDVKKPEPDNPTPFISRAYRLKATPIITKGFSDGDEWTFEHQYESIDDYVEELMPLVNTRNSKSKDLKKILEYISTVDSFPGKLKPTKKSIERARGHHPQLSKLFDEYLQDGGPSLKWFPFHLFYSLRFLVNYEYEWVPYELPSEIPRAVVNISDFAGKLLSTKQVTLPFKESPEYGKLKEFANRKVPYWEAKTLHVRSAHMHECNGCGISWIKHKRCSRCLNAWYCSVQCQTDDWKRHKDVCVY